MTPKNDNHRQRNPEEELIRKDGHIQRRPDTDK